MGEGGVLPLNRAEGCELFFTPLVFFWVTRCHVFLGVLRENIFLGGLHICQGKIIYSNILRNV